MKLTRKERAERRASFREMNLPDKADYLYTYYKLPILLGAVALAFLCSTVHRQLTKKDAILYAACINVSVGERLESRLNEGFIFANGADPKKTEVYLYRGLYLSDGASAENQEYGYASGLKLMASMEAKQLDIVLMNQEAYEIFSQNGYLLDFGSLLPPDTYSLLEPYLTINGKVVNGMDASLFPMFQEAGLSDRVYLGVIANSPRLPAVLQYIEYLSVIQEETE